MNAVMVIVAEALGYGFHELAGIIYGNEVRPRQTLLYRTPAQFKELHGNKDPDV